jgi:hypothetical protein
MSEKYPRLNLDPVPPNGRLRNLAYLAPARIAVRQVANATRR